MRYAISRIASIFAVAACATTMEIASAQTPPATVDDYLGAAKIAAGTDWAGAFLRLCIPASAGPQTAAPVAATGAAAVPRRPPARETWYAEPAKVADNLYFLGTKIHSAWAIVGSQGIIVIEALFDYAAQDEILGGLKKLGLDQTKVKYVILSHAHADHDGGASLLQDSIPGVHLIYGAEDWEAIDKSTNHAGGKPKHDMVGTDGMKVSVGDAFCPDRHDARSYSAPTAGQPQNPQGEFALPGVSQRCGSHTHVSEKRELVQLIPPKSTTW